ncbi:MAG: VOC family protein [Saprospiraceae bacterium]
MKKLDHIGIAVKNLALAKEAYSTLLNMEPTGREKGADEKGTTLLYQLGETKIELLEPADVNSPIRDFIEKNGEGIHHIAFEVDDIQSAMDEYKSKGFTFSHEKPGIHADNKLRVCINPKETHGVMIELCQSI